MFPIFLPVMTEDRIKAMADPMLEDAIRRSRECPYCDGLGYARVYDPRYRGHTVEVITRTVGNRPVRSPVTLAVNAHCLCPLGRWMRLKVDRKARDGVPDLADVLKGSSRWTAIDPTGEALPFRIISQED